MDSRAMTRLLSSIATIMRLALAVLCLALMGCSGNGGAAPANAGPPDAGCGIDSLGQETCACTGKVCTNCTCPRPATWTALGGECGDSACLIEGGLCSPAGSAASLQGQACVMNGNVCFSSDSDGKHGCVCASDPSGDFVMRCGLVEGWFTDNGQSTMY